MWYNGATGNHWEGIGLATSFDGRAWTKYANNPVFVPNQTGWDSHEVATPTVILVNGVFIMVYQGMATPGPCWFGVAYSQDGIQWTRASSQSVFAPARDGSRFLELQTSSSKTANSTCGTRGDRMQQPAGKSVMRRPTSYRWGSGAAVDSTPRSYTGAELPQPVQSFNDDPVRVVREITRDADGLRWTRPGSCSDCRQG